MKIGGKEREIAFTINALLELKNEHNVDILKGMNKDAFGPEEIRAIAFIGFKHGEKKEGRIFQSTIEEVGDWLTIPIVAEIFKVLTTQSSSENATGKAGE
jgi:hypothetical protein